MARTLSPHLAGSCLKDCSLLNQTSCLPVKDKEKDLLQGDIDEMWLSEGCYNTTLFKRTQDYQNFLQVKISNLWSTQFEKRKHCHSLVLILIIISIRTMSDNIFGQNSTPPHPPQTQPCLILPKLLTFQVIRQNKSCLSI